MRRNNTQMKLTFRTHLLKKINMFISSNRLRITTMHRWVFHALYLHNDTEQKKCNYIFNNKIFLLCDCIAFVYFIHHIYNIYILACSGYSTICLQNNKKCLHIHKVQFVWGKKVRFNIIYKVDSIERYSSTYAHAGLVLLSKVVCEVATL